jgi:hypothetical protein
MSSFRSSTGRLAQSGGQRDLRRRLFARFGSAPILIVVVVVVIGWISVLGWMLTRLLG